MMLSRLFSSPSSPLPCFVFDNALLEGHLHQHQSLYHEADPFPHTVIDNFLPTTIAEELHHRFPSPQANCWFDPRTRDATYQANKLGIGNASRLKDVDPWIISVLWAFNSSSFLRFLEQLTGIERLIPDPHFYGGGMHQSLRGAKLNIHADFNYLPELNLYRRINVLCYLNPDWDDIWGGHLELWDKDMNDCAQKIAPVLNRCVIFNTSGTSYHGHPHPMSCPEHITRKSLAFYYYTTEPLQDDLEHHSTLWQKTPDA